MKSLRPCLIAAAFLFATLLLASCEEKIKNLPVSKVEGEKRIDPYHGSIWEHFSPEQVDFSKDFLELRNKQENVISSFIGYDFSSVWQTGDIGSRNGVLGQNYQRIQIHISAIKRNFTDSAIYFAQGKSKVNNNICDFKGEIKPIKLFLFDECDRPPDSTYKCGTLYAAYTFYEDSTQKHSGKFTGIVESSVFVDGIKKVILIDDTDEEDADGYWNNSFVGIWTDYKTNKAKKCIWGDYRLPFTTGVFDCGDGEMIVCDEYVKNGWQTYNHNPEYEYGTAEYTLGDSGKFELKDKWWKK